MILRYVAQRETFYVWNLYVDPALCGIALDQNGMALDQLIKR
jgi:hypothetical protein